MSLSPNAPQQSLSIGEQAPNFQARSTRGPIELSEFAGRWVVLYFHPADFTPVGTTECVSLARAAQQFTNLNCEIMAVSIGSLYSHLAWVRAMHDAFDIEVAFPIIEDPTLQIVRAYGMVSNDAESAASARSAFVIDPQRVVRAIIAYPEEMGRPTDEVLRLVRGLQFSDAGNGLIPEGWHPGMPAISAAPPTLETVFSAAGPLEWVLRTLPAAEAPTGDDP